MFTSNDGPRDISEPREATGSFGRNTHQTRQATQPINTSATMISDVLAALFMPPKINVDRGGGQAKRG